MLPQQQAQQQQMAAAAALWQMQMSNPNGMMMPGMPGMPGMPAWPPPMPMAMPSPVLSVRVDGLKFEYQLTEDDVRKVFTRYGGVQFVNVDKDGTNAQVQFEHAQQAVTAQHDLDRKQLAGMAGAFLRVDFAMQPGGYDPALAAQMAMVGAAQAAQDSFAANSMMPPAAMSGYPMGAPSSPNAMDRPKKYTCKLEVGIENEGEFRVGSRVIQIARQIWQDQKFQEQQGKTRLRGKGIGGPHEADEPLALCISCRDQASFDKAVSYAESQLHKVHADFRTFCQQKGKPVPELEVKITKKGSNFLGPGDAALTSSADLPRGERPANAPTDDEIERLIEERNEARKSSNFKRADDVRDYLKSVGVVLMDEKNAKGNFKGNEVTTWRFWRP